MVANTAMDTDKIKIYGARVKVDSFSKVAAIEQAEKDKMVLARRPLKCRHRRRLSIRRGHAQVDDLHAIDATRRGDGVSLGRSPPRRGR